ncbi:MAG: FmdB family zinc ribbon protein [Gemmataceae bacterium]
MPTYDYVCDACKHEFEEFQYMSEEPLKKCPECGKMTLRRLIGTGAGVIFKGSGFYETDYRSDSYKQAAKKESESSSSSSDSKSSSDGNSKSGTTSSESSSSGGEKSSSESKSAKSES